jgi:hypothetical protein
MPGALVGIAYDQPVPSILDATVWLTAECANFDRTRVPLCFLYCHIFLYVTRVSSLVRTHALSSQHRIELKFDPSICPRVSWCGWFGGHHAYAACNLQERNGACSLQSAGKGFCVCVHVLEFVVVGVRQVSHLVCAHKSMASVCNLHTRQKQACDRCDDCLCTCGYVMLLCTLRRVVCWLEGYVTLSRALRTGTTRRLTDWHCASCKLLCLRAISQDH